MMKLNEEYFILEHFKNSNKDITLRELQDKSKILVDVKIEPYPVEKLDCEIEYTCPSTPIVRDTYYLTDDIDNYIVKEEATGDVVAIIKRDKLRDWEAFHAASDVVNYLNLSEEEKHKPLGEW